MIGNGGADAAEEIVGTLEVSEYRDCESHSFGVGVTWPDDAEDPVLKPDSRLDADDLRRIPGRDMDRIIGFKY